MQICECARDGTYRAVAFVSVAYDQQEIPIAAVRKVLRYRIYAPVNARKHLRNRYIDCWLFRYGRRT